MIMNKKKFMKVSILLEVELEESMASLTFRLVSSSIRRKRKGQLTLI